MKCTCLFHKEETACFKCTLNPKYADLTEDEKKENNLVDVPDFIRRDGIN
jgi:hypothetical protein